MQFSQDPALYSQVSLYNPLLIFAVGVIFGSIIGINGLIIMGLIGAGYYYRDNLAILVNKIMHQNLISVTNNTPSWLPWNK